MIKTNHMSKRIAAVVLALIMICAMGVTAFAVDSGNYNVSLINTGAPLPLNIFDNPGIVTNANNVSTLTVDLLDLQVWDSETGLLVDGYVSTATPTATGIADGYNAYVVENYDPVTGDPIRTLVVTCPSTVTAAQFSANLWFTIIAYDSNGTPYPLGPVTGDVVIS